jgi:predicted DNA-binding transcriptional regulator YafY
LVEVFVNRLERMYAITEELRRRAPATVSATSLADRFGVARRTVERDLAALRAAGVAVDGATGRSGGYTLLPTRGNVVVTLGPEEIVALLLATRATVGMPFSAAAGVATERLVDALPTLTKISAASLRERIRVASPSPTTVRPSVQRNAEAAVRGGLVLRIQYADASGSVTKRAVEAHGFYGATDGWYLVGWCRLRHAGRMFRLDRIVGSALTQETATARDLDDVLGWVPTRTIVP